MRLQSIIHFPPFLFSSFGQPIIDWWRYWGGNTLRSPLLTIVLFASLFLTGCVQYDVGIQFNSPSSGRIVQHIQLASQLKSFNSAIAQQWLDAIEQRSQRVGGVIERLPNQDLVVTIPFTSATDLETKFNQFFSDTEKKPSANAEVVTDLPKIESHLKLTRNNFLLVERNRLRYDLDLRSLGILSSGGNLLISPGSLINLEFRVNTPWGARSVEPQSVKPEVLQGGKELVWRLVPGEPNHLEAVFWLPSPLGIGTLAIILLVIIGTYLRYPESFSRKPSFTSEPTDTPSNAPT